MNIALDSLFDHVIVIGEGRPFLTALVVLNPEICKELAINPADPGEKAQEIVLNRIDERIQGFPGFAKIPKVLVMSEQWSVENGLITPTLKARRGRIMDRYAAQIEEMYEDH